MQRSLNMAIDSLLAIVTDAVNNPVTAAAVCALAVIGTISALKAVLNVINFFYVYFLRPGVSVKRFGPWAVVTGATDGIGKAYCVELAKKGINLVVVSRTEAKLQDLASELQSKYGVKVKHVTADLTSTDAGMWKELEGALEPLEIGLLINNAGQSYDHADYTELVPEKWMTDMIEMNVTSLTKLCRIVLPGMKLRKRGYIVNIGSASGNIPACPFISMYAGTKAYVDSFSRGLDAEVRRFGIRVQCQAPFLVATKLAKIRRTSLDVPSAAGYVKAAMKQIGYEPSSVSYWFHALMFNVVWSMPTRMAESYVYGMHNTLRTKALKKKAKAAKDQ